MYCSKCKYAKKARRGWNCNLNRCIYESDEENPCISCMWGRDAGDKIYCMFPKCVKRQPDKGMM
jgi:hypothetical protein